MVLSPDGSYSFYYQIGQKVSIRNQKALHLTKRAVCIFLMKRAKKCQLLF